jgi:Mce-associated membrane protein
VAAEELTDEPEDTEAPEDTADTEEPAAKRRWRPRFVHVAIVLLVAAAAFAGLAGWSFLRASGDDALGYATARDDALKAGRQQVAELTTLDYHDVDGGISRWLTVTTGKLHDELAGTDDQTKNTLRQNATVSTGNVLDAAVSELDERAGTAKLLVSVEITQTKAGAQPTTKRNRFAAALTRTDGGWKLSALDQVPLGTR